MPNSLRVFAKWTRADGELGFYTKFTSAQIPAVEGCYAWFLPLWIYEKDLDRFLKIFNELMRYETNPEPTTSARFNNWESIHLKVRRDTSMQVTDANRELWNRLLADPEHKQALQNVLLQASVLMPPLYVGRTNNLHRRYVEHTQGSGGKFNDFHSRFKDSAEKAEVPWSIRDLLFVCIKTAGQLDESHPDAKNIESLLEHVLMQICRPPFSLK